jgi:hypothetical protein
MVNGCSYGRESRVMLDNIKADITEIKIGIRDIQTENKDLFNHQSDRWPKGAVWAMGILTAITSAILTASISRWL